MFSKLLGWLVIRARSDTRRRSRSRYSTAAAGGHRHALARELANADFHAGGSGQPLRRAGNGSDVR